MTQEQKAAFINARSATLSAETQMMVAANIKANWDGLPTPYGPEKFQELIASYSDLNHNSLVEFFK